MLRKYLAIILLVILSSCEKNNDGDSRILKLYGDALEDIGYSISKITDAYYIGGQFTEVVRNDQGNSIDAENSRKKMAIIKTGLDGNTIWKKSFGGDLVAVGAKVLALDDGSVVSTGYVIDAVTGQKDIIVVKVSSDGGNSIQKIFNGSGEEVYGNPDDGNQYGIDLVQSADGFVLLGSTDLERLSGSDPTGNIKGNSDVFLLKLDSNLEPVGVPKVTGFPGNDEGAAIKQDGNGGYIIVGTTDQSEPDQSLNNILVIKTNSDAVATQTRILGSTDDEYASDIEVLDDGYMIAGTVGSESTDQWVYVTKVPENIFADQLCERKYKVVSASSNATSFAVMAISRYRNSSFVMAGQAGTGSSAKMLVFITDSEGVQVEGKEMVTAATGIQVAYDVISDDDDNIIAVGKNSYENNSMISLYKFRF